jgi:hypothetical protein
MRLYMLYSLRQGHGGHPRHNDKGRCQEKTRNRKGHGRVLRQHGEQVVSARKENLLLHRPHQARYRSAFLLGYVVPQSVPAYHKDQPRNLHCQVPHRDGKVRKARLEQVASEAVEANLVGARSRVQRMRREGGIHQEGTRH